MILQRVSSRLLFCCKRTIGLHKGLRLKQALEMSIPIGERESPMSLHRSVCPRYEKTLTFSPNVNIYSSKPEARVQS